MRDDRSQLSLIDIRSLSVDNFRSYGWLRGKTIRLNGSLPAFSSAETDFWQEHIFNPGIGGETQVLWATYRNRQREVSRLRRSRNSS
jgi:ureidoglycolate lyase